MFGFGKRKRYNGSVDTKLNAEYKIPTRDNDRFPGVLAYLDLIDKAWYGGMPDDEAALYIATLYYCGLVKHRYAAEAATLLQRINVIASRGLEKGVIAQECWERFYAAIEGASDSGGQGYNKHAQHVGQPDRFFR